MMDRFKITSIACVLACAICMPTSLGAQAQSPLSNGQTVYVPAYSHIYVGGKKRPFSLAITLSIRNIDINGDIRLREVNYYGSTGQLIESFVKSETTVKPQKSVRFVVAEDDEGGGSSANFIVTWESATAVNPPIIESIMIGAQSSQGISFTSRGRAIISP